MISEKDYARLKALGAPLDLMFSTAIFTARSLEELFEQCPKERVTWSRFLYAAVLQKAAEEKMPCPSTK